MLVKCTGIDGFTWLFGYGCRLTAQHAFVYIGRAFHYLSIKGYALAWMDAYNLPPAYLPDFNDPFHAINN